jgi:hypothetical protein
MLVAFGVGILGRWAHNQKITAATAVRAVFAILVIAALDTGKTEPVAKGLASLFLAAVLLGKNSPLNAIQKIK